MIMIKKNNIKMSTSINTKRDMIIQWTIIKSNPTRNPKSQSRSTKVISNQLHKIQTKIEKINKMEFKQSNEKEEMIEW